MLFHQARMIFGLLSVSQQRSALLVVVFMLGLAAFDAAGVAALYGVLDIALGNPAQSLRTKMELWFGLTETKAVFAVMAASVAIIFIIKFLLTLLNIYLVERLTWHLYKELCHELFTYYLTRPYAFHLKTNSSDLIYNIVSALMNISRTALTYWLWMISDFILFLAMMLVMLWVNPLVSGIAMGGAGLLGGGLLLYGRRRTLRWGKVVQEANSDIHRCAVESFSVVKEIKLYGREPSFVKAMDQALERLIGASVKNTYLQQLAKPIFETVTITVLIGALSFVYLQQDSAAGLIPLFALYGAAAQRIMPAVVRLLNSLQYLRFIHSWAQRVHDDVAAARNIAAERAESARGILNFDRIVFDGVGLTYETAERPALAQIDLTINRGDVVGIVGRSGAGKSSIVDILLGLLHPDVGQVWVESGGERVSAESCRGIFGYVPQSVQLIDTTIRGNITLGSTGGQEQKEQLAFLLDLCQLRDFIAAQPLGLDTVIGERGVRLSGGQRQRIAWARAMFHRPQILVLDEATAALDAVTEMAITQAVDALRGDKTLIIVAHRLSTVKNCDYLVVLDHGRIVDVGSYDELTERNSIFRAMVGELNHETVATSKESELEQPHEMTTL